MEVIIVEKWEDTVEVNSEFGSFRGIWCSSAPVTFKRYIVELDSDEVVSLDAVELSNACGPSIESVNEAIRITGFVEEIEDQAMILRMEDSLVMLQITSNLDFVPYIGHYVCVKLKKIKLYDTGI